MANIILCGHGELAIAMKNSIEMIYGKVNSFTALTFINTENREDLIDKYKQHIMQQNDHQETLILVDLFGGSPYNAAAAVAMQFDHVAVVSGMSLPLCLELADNNDVLSLNELVKLSTVAGLQCVKVFEKPLLQNNSNDEDFL